MWLVSDLMMTLYRPLSKDQQMKRVLSSRRPLSLTSSQDKLCVLIASSLAGALCFDHLLH